MMAQPAYAASSERLAAACRERGVAVQTIKAVARRRWREGEPPTTTTWYRAFEHPDDVARAIHWALARPDVFVNTASDPTVLGHTLRAAASFESAPSAADMAAAEQRLGVEPLFLPGYRAAT